MRLFVCMTAAFLIACGSGSKKASQNTPVAPVATGSTKAKNQENRQPLSGTAPLPPLPPTSGSPVQPNPAAEVVSAESVEGQFLASIQGRWRTQCERSAGASLFYGVEFKGQAWSSLLFEYSDNNACIHLAAPNEGVPKSYAITAMKLQADGWYLLQGSCISAANSCSGTASIALRLDANNNVEMKKVSATGTYFPTDTDVLTFDF